MNPYNLNDKIAIITGAARGIGKEIALVIAQNGGIPVIVDVDEKTAKEAMAEISAINPKASDVHTVNMANVPEIEKMVEAVYAKHGRIDILVNNAGIIDNTPMIEELDEALWDRVLDINLKGAFFCSKYTYQKMKEKNSGRIINIASVAGRMGGYSVGCAYAASKAGMIGMTMNFSRKCAPYGILVNAVAPGTIESDMSRQFTPEQMERLYANIPMRRLGKPSDIANTVLFLASDACSFVTGAVFDINGGMRMG